MEHCSAYICFFFIAICSSSQTPLEMVPRLNPNSTNQSINQSKLSPNMKRFFTQCCQRVSISTYLCQRNIMFHNLHGMLILHGARSQQLVSYGILFSSLTPLTSHSGSTNNCEYYTLHIYHFIIEIHVPVHNLEFSFVSRERVLPL